MAESSGSGRAPQWQDATESELRALSPRLDVPPAAEQAAAVRRLEEEQRRAARRLGDRSAGGRHGGPGHSSAVNRYADVAGGSCTPGGGPP